MKEILISREAVQGGCRELLAALEQGLEAASLLPSYYGANLDALYDVLTRTTEPLLLRLPCSEEALLRDERKAPLGALLDRARREQPLLYIQFSDDRFAGEESRAEETATCPDFIGERFSCRAFLPLPPSETKLRALARAAQQAPTAMNRQELHFRCLRDPQLIRKLSLFALSKLPPDAQERIRKRGEQGIFYGAPAVFLISVRASEANSYTPMNAGIAALSIAHAATALSLDSCIVGLIAPAFPASRDRCAEGQERELRAALRLSEEESVLLAVCTGFASCKKKGHELLSRVDFF